MKKLWCVWAKSLGEKVGETKNMVDTKTLSKNQYILIIGNKKEIL